MTLHWALVRLHNRQSLHNLTHSCMRGHHLHGHHGNMCRGLLLSDALQSWLTCCRAHVHVCCVHNVMLSTSIGTCVTLVTASCSCHSLQCDKRFCGPKKMLMLAVGSPISACGSNKQRLFVVIHKVTSAATYICVFKCCLAGNRWLCLHGNSAVWSCKLSLTTAATLLCGL